MIYYYRSILSYSPLDIPDDVLPFLSGNFKLVLSSLEPWYSFLVNLLYSILNRNFGIAVNVLQVTLIAFAPASMYFLLSELGIKRPVRLVFSLFYVINPIIFPNILIFNPLMWPEFYIFMPILAIFLIRFSETGEISNLFKFFLILSFYLEIQTSPNLYNLRLIIPYLGLFFIFASIYGLKKYRKKLLYSILFYSAVCVFFILFNFIPILDALGFFEHIGTLSEASASSAFFDFHYANVVFTYQSQNWFFAISGLVVYPSASNSFLEGYGHEFYILTVLFVAYVLASLFTTILMIFRKGKNYRYALPIVVSVILIWIFIASVQSGVSLFFFRLSSFFFLWEYPGYLETSLMFLYTILFAFSLEYITSDSSRQYFEKFFKKFPKQLRKKHLTFRTFLVIIVILFSLIFSPIIVVSPHYSRIPSQSSVLPQSYDVLSRFFTSQTGNFEILPVPVNESIYSRLETLVDPSRMYVVPYAFQNNPNNYPNLTLYDDIYSHISSSNFNNFAALLNESFIKFIIVFNPATNHQIISDFLDQNYLSLVFNDTNFIIFRNNVFEHSRISSPVSIAKFSENLTFSHEIKVISEINSSTALSSIHYNASMKDFVPFNVTSNTFNLHVINNNSGLAQYSEIYKFSYVPPGADLNITMQGINEQNVNGFLFIIFHDNISRKSDANIYSSDQRYIKIISNLRNFSATVSAPLYAEYVYYGILVVNKSKGNGSISFSSLSLINNVSVNETEYLYQNAVPPESILSNVPIQTDTYSGTVYENVPLITLLKNMSVINISLDAQNGIVGLHNTTAEIPGNLHSPNGTHYFLTFMVLNSSIVRIDQNSYSSNPNFITVQLSNSTSFNVEGFAIIKDLWVSFSNQTYLLNSKEVMGNSSETLTLSGTGLVEITTLQANRLILKNATILNEINKNGQDVYVLGLRGNATIFIEPASSYNLPIILFNIVFIFVFFGSVFYIVMFNIINKRRYQSKLS